MTYLRLPEVIRRTGYSKSALYRLMQEKAFPRPYQLGERAVGWCAAEVEAWCRSRPRVSGDAPWTVGRKKAKAAGAREGKARRKAGELQQAFAAHVPIWPSVHMPKGGT